MSTATAEAPRPAGLDHPAPGPWSPTSDWTWRGLAARPAQLDALQAETSPVVLDGSGLGALDSTGAWLLLHRSAPAAPAPQLTHWPPQASAWMGALGQPTAAAPAPPPPPNALARLGTHTLSAAQQAVDLLTFIGQTALVATGVLAHPRRLRVRAMLQSLQIDGAQAVPLIGITAFLLGVVVAYQGADQLQHYGANIYVVDLVGYAMLREFGPLIAAILIAGRSGSAYAAQLGTMVVTEEIDALRTLAILPTERLVLPRLIGLALALPLLTLLADAAGVFGGMVMARWQLGIGWHAFVERFGREMQGNTLCVGLGKSLVFAFIIAVVGCFQGLRTRGGADGVGRQTTLSVVQAIFLVIVADGLFSVLFNLLEI